MTDVFTKCPFDYFCWCKHVVNCWLLQILQRVLSISVSEHFKTIRYLEITYGLFHFDEKMSVILVKTFLTNVSPFTDITVQNTQETRFYNLVHIICFCIRPVHESWDFIYSLISSFGLNARIFGLPETYSQHCGDFCEKQFCENF